MRHNVFIALFTAVIFFWIYECFCLNKTTLPSRFTFTNTIRRTDVLRNFDTIVAGHNRLIDSIELKWPRYTDFDTHNFVKMLIDTLKSQTVIDTPTIRSPTITGISIMSGINNIGTITTDSISVTAVNVSGVLCSDSILSVSLKTTRAYIDTIKTAVKINRLTSDTIVNKLITSDTANQISAKIRRLRSDTIISCDTAYIKNLKWDRVHNMGSNYFNIDSSNQIYTSGISASSIDLSGVIKMDSAKVTTGTLTTRMRSDSIISTAANIKRLKPDTITTCDTAKFKAAKIIRLSGDTIVNKLLTADSIYSRKIKFGGVYDTGFTLKMIGFTDTPLVTVRARVIGQIAHLLIPANSGTSDRNFMRLEGTPTKLIPYSYGSCDYSVPVNGVLNNGVRSSTYRIVNTEGSTIFTFKADTSSVQECFATSGQKGFRDFTLTYILLGEN